VLARAKGGVFAQTGGGGGGGGGLPAFERSRLVRTFGWLTDIGEAKGRGDVYASPLLPRSQPLPITIMLPFPGTPSLRDTAAVEPPSRVAP